MKIPYSQLRSRSVTIEIHDLFILLGPSLLGELDADAEEQWYQKHKEESLAAREAMDLKVRASERGGHRLEGCSPNNWDGAGNTA